MKLSDTRIRSLKPRTKLYRLADGRGLTLEVTPAGEKLWRVRYRWAGRASMLSLGRYPEVGLANARERLLEVRRALAAGAHPLGERRASKALQDAAEAASFRAVAEAWAIEKRKRLKPKTQSKLDAILERDLIPKLGPVPIATLGTPQAVATLEAIAERAPHIANKAKGYLNEIMAFAIQKGLRDEGRHLTLKGVIHLPKAESFPAAIETKALRTVMQAISSHPDTMIRTALLLAAYTALRPFNVVSLRWSYVDEENDLLRIPAESMKTDEPHEVPLPKQAKELLELARMWARGGRYADLLFPTINGTKSDHLHRDTLSKALRDSGLRGQHVPHGFRASLRTVAREEFDIDIDVLEAQLAHSVGDATQKAYNRARFIKKRKQAMQLWADFLCGLMNQDD